MSKEARKSASRKNESHRQGIELKRRPINHSSIERDKLNGPQGDSHDYDSSMKRKKENKGKKKIKPRVGTEEKINSHKAKNQVFLKSGVQSQKNKRGVFRNTGTEKKKDVTQNGRGKEKR